MAPNPMTRGMAKNLLGNALEPELQLLGFKRAGRKLVWHSTQNDLVLSLTVQFTDGAFDPFKGDRFRLELQLARKPVSRATLDGRVHLDQLMTSQERQWILARQNRWIRELEAPP